METCNIQGRIISAFLWSYSDSLIKGGYCAIQIFRVYCFDYDWNCMFQAWNKELLWTIFLTMSRILLTWLIFPEHLSDQSLNPGKHAFCSISGRVPIIRNISSEGKHKHLSVGMLQYVQYHQMLESRLETNSDSFELC